METVEGIPLSTWNHLNTERVEETGDDVRARDQVYQLSFWKLCVEEVLKSIEMLCLIASGLISNEKIA